jgi:lysophospholipase L1-like esterase
MGSGVTEEHAYSAVLERRLNEQEPGRFEVINVGLDGVNAPVAMDRLKDVVRHYRPRLLVYGYTINDVEGKHYRALPGREGEAAEFWQRARAAASSPSYLWRALWPRWMHLQAKLFPSSRSYARELELNYFENPDAAADFARALDRFAAMARERGLCALVLVHTQLDDLDGSHRYHPFYDHVERLSRERGLPVVQSFPAFEGREAKSLWVDLFDPHPNREGHEILAEVLLGALRALPESCLALPAAAASRPAPERR